MTQRVTSARNDLVMVSEPNGKMPDVLLNHNPQAKHFILIKCREAARPNAMQGGEGEAPWAAPSHCSLPGLGVG